MVLYNYYSLDECSDKKGVLKRLKELKKDGKIEFDLDGEVFKISDIDLEEEEVDELIKTFDEKDVFPYLERDEDSDDEDDLYDFDYGDDDY